MSDDPTLLGHLARSYQSALQSTFLSMQSLAQTVEEQEDETLQLLSGTVTRDLFRLERLTANLQLYSELCGEYRCKPIRTDVYAFFDELCKLAASLLSGASMTLQASLPRPGFRGNLDRTLAEAVFWNLLSNAARFSIDGAVDVSLRRDQKFAFLSVSERTAPLSQEDLQIFYDRTQVPLEETMDRQTAGLGLPIILRAAKLHGGSVMAMQNDDGRLTVAVSLDVTLPAAEGLLIPERSAGFNRGLLGLSDLLPPASFDSRDVF